MIEIVNFDFDGVITNSQKAFIETHNIIYSRNYLFSPKPKWEDVREYNFADVIPNLTDEMKWSIFGSKTFYDKLEFIDDIVRIINDLCDRGIEARIISHCGWDSITPKNKLIKSHMPKVKFQPVPIQDFPTKSHIHMENGIYIDDRGDLLDQSSATKKIAFNYMGYDVDWNRDWRNRGLETLTRWRFDIEGKYLRELLGVE